MISSPAPMKRLLKAQSRAARRVKERVPVEVGLLQHPQRGDVRILGEPAWELRAAGK